MDINPLDFPSLYTLNFALTSGIFLAIIPPLYGKPSDRRFLAG
ncbi:hypothetical protein ACSQ6I_16800 [Anabaena sp. WFMT]